MSITDSSSRPRVRFMGSSLPVLALLALASLSACTNATGNDTPSDEATGEASSALKCEKCDNSPSAPTPPSRPPAGTNASNPQLVAQVNGIAAVLRDASNALGTPDLAKAFGTAIADSDTSSAFYNAMRLHGRDTAFHGALAAHGYASMEAFAADVSQLGRVISADPNAAMNAFGLTAGQRSAYTQTVSDAHSKMLADMRARELQPQPMEICPPLMMVMLQDRVSLGVGVATVAGILLAAPLALPALAAAAVAGIGIGAASAAAASDIRIHHCTPGQAPTM